MAANKYTAGTRVAFFDHRSKAVVEDEIWLVRQGYYHMPSDDYLHDENIIGAVLSGVRVPNDLFQMERTEIISRATNELKAAAQWCGPP